ncbi:MAG: restriction endonuclease [candidate division Zixibacteria bacterium]
MPVPKYDEMFNALIAALQELGGSASILELEEGTSRALGLSEDDLSQSHDGSRSKFSYNLAWTRTYLKNYGLLENSARCVWSLTPQGMQASEIDKNVVKRAVKEKFPRSKSQTTKEMKVASDELVDEPWRQELIQHLRAMPPDSFERLCKRLLRELGFVQVDVTGRSGDGGIDGKGVYKLGGVLSFHVVFQCKRYSKTVSSPTIRDFRGAMAGRADKGLVITTGLFSRDAKREATRDGATPIDLLDGDALVDRLKDLNLGVSTEEKTIESVSISKEWFDGL